MAWLRTRTWAPWASQVAMRALSWRNRSCASAARAAPGKSGVQAAQLSAGQPGVQLVRKNKSCPGWRAPANKCMGRAGWARIRPTKAQCPCPRQSAARGCGPVAGQSRGWADKGLQRLPGLQAVQKGRAIATRGANAAQICALPSAWLWPASNSAVAVGRGRDHPANRPPERRAKPPGRAGLQMQHHSGRGIGTG